MRVPTIRWKCIFPLGVHLEEGSPGPCDEFSSQSGHSRPFHLPALPSPEWGSCRNWSFSFFFQAQVEEKIMKQFKNTFPLSYRESSEIANQHSACILLARQVICSGSASREIRNCTFMLYDYMKPGSVMTLAKLWNGSVNPVTVAQTVGYSSTSKLKMGRHIG